MPRPSLEKIIRILLRDGVVYDLDTDCLIREYANNVSALALFGILGRMDDAAPDFASSLRSEVREMEESGISGLIAFDDGRWHDLPGDAADADEEPAMPSSHFLKLVYSSDEAAYFAFTMLDYMAAPYILSGSRKREGRMHHLHVELASAGDLDRFIASLRHPHFVRVEQSSEDIFHRAPSHAV